MSPHQPRKHLGQHFLHNTATIAAIVNAINPSKKDNMAEIGPGLGALTLQLLPHLKQLDVIEVDQTLIAPLTALSNKNPQLIVHSADALTFNFKSLNQTPHALRVVGNLPYNISTPLIFHLLDQIEIIQDMHFMLQKEVVERIVAEPRTAAYGRLSVMTQYYCTVEQLFIVGPNDFTPPPKVDSAVVRLTPHTANSLQCDTKRLSYIVQQAFNQRRKTLRNSLRNVTTANALIAINIDPQQRAEELSVADFVKIVNNLS